MEWLEQVQPWWVWMVLAAVFLIAEIFTAGFFLLWFSIGSAVAGVKSAWVKDTASSVQKKS